MLPNEDHMAQEFARLKRKQIEDQVRPFRRLARAQTPRGGWVRAIREGLGMSAQQLGARVRVKRQTIENLERSEANGKITLDSLNRVAKALGCRVVYALVPEKPLDEMQRERARQIAESVVKPVSHSMRLEAQSIGKREERRQSEELVQKLLLGDPKKLWQ
jgi:predicted DNA-binding mobile mystery protein A